MSAPAGSGVAPIGTLVPLRLATFRWLWIAALVSNTGTWMREVGAGWMMKQLTIGVDGQADRLMVALVQAASALPLFLLSIPAGALADVVDRRVLMLRCQAGSLLLAAALAVGAVTGLVGPWALLAVTLGLGVSAALVNPAWQTAMTDLVPREQLPAAATLNSMSLNLSRAIGPTIGGVLVAAAGPWAAFALNAVSLVGISWVLWRWRHEAPNRAVVAERFFGAMQAGVRYVRHSEPMRAVLARTVSFVLFASCLWALMPMLAAEHVGLGATGYGIMLGCLGAGAVGAGLVLPIYRARIGPNRMVVGATLAYAGAMAGLALAPSPAVAYGAMTVAGAGWLAMVTSLNVSAQSGVPTWVRARALACYFSVFFGCMAIGSILWGMAAKWAGLAPSLLIGSGLMLAGLGTIGWWRLRVVAGEDLDRSHSWEDPRVTHEIGPDDGPVAVTVEYRIPPASAEAFRVAMEPVARTRYRDGAISWLLTRDTEDPEKWLEIFIVESWAEHLRQHDRVTVGDKKIQDHAKSYHAGPGRPLVRHFIAVGSGRQSPRPAPEGHVD